MYMGRLANCGGLGERCSGPGLGYGGDGEKLEYLRASPVLCYF